MTDNNDLVSEFQKLQLETISKFRNEMNEVKESVLKAVEKTKKDMLREIRKIRSEKGIEKTENKEKESTENPIYRKEFEMKKTFKITSELPVNESFDGELEEHFGVTWESKCYPDGEYMCFLIIPVESKNNEEFGMEAEITISTISSDGQTISKRGEKVQSRYVWFWKFRDFLEWKDVKNNYLIDGILTIQVNFQIHKVGGIYQPNRKRFDESMKEFSEVEISVGGRKFYLYNLLKLSSLSPFFKKLLSSLLINSENREVLVDDGIDPNDFQVFLEVLYDEPVDERTVEICLLLAGGFEAETIIRRCEEFLIEKSQKTMKKKLQLAIKYELDVLKKKCISELKTTADVYEVASWDFSDSNPLLMAELFKKLLSLK